MMKAKKATIDSGKDIEQMLEVHKHSIISALLFALEKIGALSMVQIASREFHNSMIEEYNKIVPRTFEIAWEKAFEKGSK